MATVYVPPEIGVGVMDELAQKKVGEVWLNPGADRSAVVERARQLGLKTIQACSIIGIGESPRSHQRPGSPGGNPSSGACRPAH